MPNPYNYQSAVQRFLGRSGLEPGPGGPDDIASGRMADLARQSVTTMDPAEQARMRADPSATVTSPEQSLYAQALMQLLQQLKAGQQAQKQSVKPQSKAQE